MVNTLLTIEDSADIFHCGHFQSAPDQLLLVPFLPIKKNRQNIRCWIASSHDFVYRNIGRLKILLIFIGISL